MLTKHIWAHLSGGKNPVWFRGSAPALTLILILVICMQAARTETRFHELEKEQAIINSQIVSIVDGEIKLFFSPGMQDDDSAPADGMPSDVPYNQRASGQGWPGAQVYIWAGTPDPKTGKVYFRYLGVFPEPDNRATSI